MNTKQTGDISVAEVISRFIKAGKSVSIPFGDRDRYDLIVDNNGLLSRVQVKTAWKDSDSSIIFSARSITTQDGKWTHNDYKGQIELFAVYYPELDKVYLVPIDKCTSSTMILRLSPAKNNQKKNVNLASDFEFNVL